MLTDLLLKYTSQKELVDYTNEQGVAGILFSDYAETHERGEKLLERKEFLRLSMYMDYCQKSYVSYGKVLAHLADFYAKHGIKMMVLKGYGASLDWPVPWYRPCGDLDVFLFEDAESSEIQEVQGSRAQGLKYDGVWKRGDEALEKELGLKIDIDHEHHTNFSFEGISVENHYDFINVKGHKDAPAIETILKKFALTDMKEIKVNGTKVYLPSANFNALFLLRHMGQHFAGSEMNLRQILDWGYFMKKHSNEVDWAQIMPIYEKMGITVFFNQVNAICVDYLDVDEDVFPKVNRDEALEKRIIRNVLAPEFDEELPKGNVLKVIWFKNRRYWANSWKRKLIFKDSPMVDFMYGSVAHLRKWKSVKE